MELDYDQLLAKQPYKDDAVFAWHQDMAYWPDTPDTRTATIWLAIDDSTVDNGCMRFVPGTDARAGAPAARAACSATAATSHALGTDLLDGDVVVDVPIRRGDCTVHNERVMHGSGGNRHRRLPPRLHRRLPVAGDDRDRAGARLHPQPQRRRRGHRFGVSHRFGHRSHGRSSAMNAGFWIFLLVLGPVLLFIVWLVLLETSVRIEPGTLGLALLRGKSTGKVMGPGRHFMRPWRKVMIQTYPSRELALIAGGLQQSNPDVDYIEEAASVFLGDSSSARGAVHRSLPADPRQAAGRPRHRTVRRASGRCCATSAARA